MKYLCYIIIASVISGCGDNAGNGDNKNRDIKVSAVTTDMGCENCGMNIKKFISTGHAVKMKDSSSHFFCSINCSTAAWDSLASTADSVFAVDYNSTKYIYAPDAYYVIGSSLKGTMTSISKFTFENLSDAESFSKSFSGREIVDYQSAFSMSKEEILKRRK